MWDSRQVPQRSGQSPQRKPREAARADVDGMAPIGGELDNFIRLRSYILYMQEGASLLLWREDGLQLCWFWIDRNCSSLHWEIDEQADEEGGVTCEAGGGSILLADITDIVPLGAGPDQLSDSPTDSSFSVVLGGARLDIVAPTSLDFQVWYFGLAFATRLRLNAMASGVAEGAALSESSTDREESEGESDGGWAGDVRALLRRGAASGGATLDAEESRAVLEGMDAQARALAALQKENARLRDERRSKDEAISRLLADLQEAQGARGDGEEGGARREAKTGSEESDRNWQVREVFRARQRARQLDEIARVKNASLQLLTLLLAEATC